MLILTFDGNVGRDAEQKTTTNSEFCSFPVAVTTGYGDNKATVWVDVTKWGKGAHGLANILVKGSKVTVSGEMSLREHNGKTYVQCRADHVSIGSTPNRADSQQAQRPASNSFATDDLDDDPSIPF